jgi:hypothetical protein
MDVLSGWASLRAWRASARSCCESVPGYSVIHSADGVVVGDQAVAPLLGLVQRQGGLGRAALLLVQRGAHGVQRGFVQLAHELAHVLHLAALALEVGDALGLGQASVSFSGSAAVQQVGAQRQQLSPSFCSSVLSRLRSVRLASVVPLSSALSSRSSSLPSATNWPRTK